jgi:WD40 repeat protein/serine/threonine protein kinase
MNTKSRTEKGEDSITREIRACIVCGATLSATSEFCPVCMLRRALAGGVESGKSFPENDFISTPSDSAQRFGHYELVTDKDGQPVELGRGAMGVTYKALDVDLRCPVTLKVIREKYLANQLARLRFLREARAAASVRHPNVASVFHLGRRGRDYFYAMEFVAGETLESLMKRSGRLEAKFALEIAAQVAAGLTAVHKQNLVHRDIKPSNIMVTPEDGRTVIAKIIDLGLVKAVGEPHPEATISIPGSFAGTPHFASPEQCAGRLTDIRSDLYSLGVTLWQMVAGKLPFDGTPGEVMGQHLHAPLPLGQLRHIQQPVIALIKFLLDKDPAKRPQSPLELQTLLRKVQAALDVKVQVKPRGALQTPSEVQAKARGGRKPRAKAGKDVLHGETRGRIPGRLDDPWDLTPFLFAKLESFTGREWLFEVIDEWRTKSSQSALLIIGEPGVGKSSIVAALIDQNREGQVLAYHCCRADTPATLDPANFVRSLVAMLSARLDGYASRLAESLVADALRFADTDPACAFENAILGPLHKYQQPECGRRYLLIDALDEALARAQRPTIVDLLSARLNLLPPWLGIIATTRSEPAVLSRLGGVPTYIVSAKDPRNQDDLRQFFDQRFAQPGFRERVQVGGERLTKLATSLLRSSAGNFLFVTTALDALESGQLGLHQVENLPPGLSSLYELFFDRLFQDAGVDFARSRPVLDTIAAAYEPLSREDIAAATSLDAEEELPGILVRVASFLSQSEGRYAFFHRSLFDWLTGWDRQQDRPLAGPYHVSLEKGRIRLADWCWTAYKHVASKIPGYCLRHLPNHLHQVGRVNDERTVLLDFEFLQAKLEATDANSVLADFENLAREADLRLVQSAIRLSAHVLARDSRQLAGQLTGRLLGNIAPGIQALLKQGAEMKAWPWLRPLKPSLTPPGGSLIRTLEGHSNWVTAAALTPDGGQIVSASYDRTLRVWDLESGRSLRTFEGHSREVNGVAITPDGRRAVSASGDTTLKVWDPENGQILRTLEGHRGWVSGVAITPDGRCAVSASYDWTLRVWDLESGRSLRTLEGHTGCVHGVAIAPDGRLAVSASEDATLRLWDLQNGRSLRTFEGHMGLVSAAVVTPDGRRVVSASGDHTLRIWDLESGQSLRTLEGHTGWVHGVAITADGRRAVSASADQTLRIWDLETGQSLRILGGHTDLVSAAVLTPDGRRAVSASADHTLRVWDLESDQSVRALEGHTDWVTAVIPNLSGRHAELTSDYHTLRVRDLESGQSLRALEGHTDWVTAAAVSPDWRRAVSASADQTLRAWDLESGQSLCTLMGHTDVVSAVAVAPNGRHAVSASADQTLRVWDLESGQSLRTLEGHTDLVSAVAVALDGRRAVCALADQTLRVWDLESGQSLRTLQGHTGWVNGVVVTPDQYHAVSASADHTLRVWDLESGQSLRTLTGHTDVVSAVALTPDGRRAVSASADHTLRVWDLESGECIAAYTAEGSITRCAVALDGRTIIATDRVGRGHFLWLEEVF